MSWQAGVALLCIGLACHVLAAWLDARFPDDDDDDDDNEH